MKPSEIEQLKKPGAKPWAINVAWNNDKSLRDLVIGKVDWFYAAEYGEELADVYFEHILYGFSLTELKEPIINKRYDSELKLDDDSYWTISMKYSYKTLNEAAKPLLTYIFEKKDTI